MGKKVLLVTLFDDNNIGNRLQNYALKHILELHGTRVFVVNNGYTTYPTQMDRLKWIIKGTFGIFKIKNYSREYRIYKLEDYRRQANKLFDKNNITNIIVTNNKQVFRTDWSSFDIAVAKYLFH